MQRVRSDARHHAICLLGEVWRREAALVERVAKDHGKDAGLRFAAMLSRSFNELVDCVALVGPPLWLTVWTRGAPCFPKLSANRMFGELHVHWHSAFPSRSSFTTLAAQMKSTRAMFDRMNKPDQEIFQIRVSAAMVRKVVR